MMEAIAILATLVRRARFEWDGVHAPEPLSRVTLRPKGGMPLQGVAARVPALRRAGCGASRAKTQTGASAHAREPDMAIRFRTQRREAEEEEPPRVPRKKVTRIQGNTLGARRRLKKMAGKARAAKAKAAG